MEKRPHILIFNPDQFRGDALGHMGNSAALTPNLDKIIEEDGVSFRNAFCQNPVCTPSRCSFMSGWYPHVRGHRTMFHMMHEDEPVLLKTLKDEGYYVWWGGKNDLIPGQNSFAPFCNYKNKEHPRKKGLHGDLRWRGEKGGDNFYSFYAGKLDKGDEIIYHDSDWCNVEAAVDFIHNAPTNQPLCMYLPLQYPHPPYGVEEPWFSNINRDNIPKRIPAYENWNDKPSILEGIYNRQNMKGWSQARWTELRATYYGMCSRIDYQFGMVIDALKQQELYNDTAIFVFSDHGDFTGDYGLVEKTQNTFQDVLTRVPFIIKPPISLKIKAGINNALVELIDFTATVEALTGIEPKHTHFGRSLIPVLQGREEHRDAVFCEGGRLKGEAHCSEAKSEGSWDDNNLYWPRVNLQISEGPEHSKATMLRTKDYKYVKRLYETDELYDLNNDPKELINQINNPKYKEMLIALKERMLTFYQETCDVVPYTEDDR